MSGCLFTASTGLAGIRLRPIAPSIPRTQVRHATLIKRPKRPYTFTQLITLSDGSSFIHRTTSPQPVYKSTKDQRNTSLWNPSLEKLRNVETDEAGRLKAFRDKFGRGWDAVVDTGKDVEASDEDNFLDLITGPETKSKKDDRNKTSKSAAPKR